MGRKPTVNANLPPRMRARVRRGITYYTYDHGGKPRKETPLGTDYVLAVRKWGELHDAEPTEKLTFRWAVSQFRASPDYEALTIGTQADYEYAFDKLLPKFGDAPLDEIEPPHFRLYIDWRTKGDEKIRASKHRALREKNIASRLFNWCIERGYCKLNPAGAVKTKKLPGRKDVYIYDEMLDSVYDHAPVDLRDAMDLGYYIGQRPGDLLDMTLVSRRNGWLEYRQSKTGTPQRIKMDAQIIALIDRIEARKSQYKVHSMYLLVNERGHKMTKSMLRSRFEKAREAAGYTGEQFQFRDLRRKAGTDLRDQKGLDAAQDLLGHKDRTMTEHYTAARGKKVSAIPKRSRASIGSKS